MPDVTVFNLGGQDINVKDASARSSAQNANTVANEASATANKAMQKVEEIENLSRVTISYTPSTETVTITTIDHKK